MSAASRKDWGGTGLRPVLFGVPPKIPLSQRYPNTPGRTAPKLLVPRTIGPVRPAHDDDSTAFRPLHSTARPLRKLRGRYRSVTPARKLSRHRTTRARTNPFRNGRDALPRVRNKVNVSPKSGRHASAS